LLVVSSLLLLAMPLGLTSSQSAQADLITADQTVSDLESAAQAVSPVDGADPGDTADTSAGPADPTATAGAVTDAVAAPAIAWKPCTVAGLTTSAFRCASYPVPLDYRDPSGATVLLSLQKRLATDPDPARKIGTVFLNPGGPGSASSGMVGAATRFLGAAAARFDVIAFDPRGVGASTPVRCFADDASFLATYGSKVVPVPLSQAEISSTISATKAYTGACRSGAGPVLAHMSTLNVARDLDILRRAVGDNQLNYLGFSYGTLIGATYANLYPGRVRAIALDGNVDFAGRTQNRLLNKFERASGFEEALRAWFGACDAAGKGCAFSSGGSAAKFAALRERLRAGPLTLSGGTAVTLSALTSVVGQYLYRITLYQALGSLLQSTYTAAFPAPAPVAAPATAGAAVPAGTALGGTPQVAAENASVTPQLLAVTDPAASDPALPVPDPAASAPTADTPTSGATPAPSTDPSTPADPGSGADPSTPSTQPAPGTSSDPAPSTGDSPADGRTGAAAFADPAWVFASELPLLPLVDGIDPTPQTVELPVADGDAYSFTSTDSFFGVNCVDAPLPRMPWAYPQFADWYEKAHRTFGRQEAFAELACASWPVLPYERYAGPWNRRTAAPLLLVNGIHDPATPLLFAKRSVRELRNARLLTLDGFGHTSSGTSSCVTAAYVRYFVDGLLPDVGARCAQDATPFPTP
jgi:pimeloyl-ACP methyl ester carboxylesterase